MVSMGRTPFFAVVHVSLSMCTIVPDWRKVKQRGNLLQLLIGEDTATHPTGECLKREHVRVMLDVTDVIKVVTGLLKPIAT